MPLFRPRIQHQAFFPVIVIEDPGALTVGEDFLYEGAVVEHTEHDVFRKNCLGCFFMRCIRIIDYPDCAQVLQNRCRGEIIREESGVRGRIVRFDAVFIGFRLIKCF